MFKAEELLEKQSCVGGERPTSSGFQPPSTSRALQQFCQSSCFSSLPVDSSGQTGCETSTSKSADSTLGPLKVYRDELFNEWQVTGQTKRTESHFGLARWWFIHKQWTIHHDGGADWFVGHMRTEERWNKRSDLYHGGELFSTVERDTERMTAFECFSTIDSAQWGR